VKLQEEFDRERDRLVRERHEIKISAGGVVGMGGVAGVFGVGGLGGVGGRLGPNDDDKVSLKSDTLPDYEIT
jgi:ABC-type methionine transport system permease subunit